MADPKLNGESKSNKLLTFQRLREVLRYDPEAGQFWWRTRLSARCNLSKPAGSFTNKGYARVRIDGFQYLSHRLAWLYVHGAMPTDEIDHIDNDKTNNRLSNLRQATRSENAQNSGGLRKVSTLKGVTKTSRGWVAKIKARGHQKYLGTFPTEQHAHAAYVAAAITHHGAFANEGRIARARSKLLPP